MTMLAPSQARRFRALYLGELDFVWTVLRRLGVDESQVEDAAHDVFVVVHRQLDGFEGRSSERTWLYAIARRIAWRYRRTQRRRARRRAALATQPHPPAEPEQDEALRRREASAMLQAFLETLDRPKREAFVLGELERLPRASLGRALGVSPGTAYSRLRAARADFAAAFGPDGPRSASVHRLARDTETTPRAARQRLWLALPGGWLGASGSVLGVSAVAGIGIVGLVVLRGLLPDPSPDPRGVGAAAAPVSSPSREPSPEAERSPVARAPVPRAASALPPDPAAVPRGRRVDRAAGIDDKSSRLAERDGIDTIPSRSDSPGTAPADPIPSSTPEDTLAQEAALMTQARAEMRAGRWTRAWARLSEHAERFPAGHLVAEGHASAVVVACRLGHRDDALARARALLSQPTTPSVLTMLRSTCIADRLESIHPAHGGDQGG